jgi:hypothetical protein
MQIILTDGMPLSIQPCMNWIRAARSVTQDAKGFSDGYALQVKIYTKIKIKCCIMQLLCNKKPSHFQI